MLRKSTITLLAVALSGVALAAVTAAGSSADTHGTSSVLYSSLVSPYSATNVPNEWWSFSYGGNNATQFGDKINLASQSRLSGATVMLDSQAVGTGTFSVPITFTIYKPGATGGSIGAVVATQTKTFNVPYRPAGNTTACAATTSSIFAGSANDGTQWFSPATGSCYYGVVYAANFNFDGPRNLPSTVVYGVSYNATTGPASSLNVLLSTESSSGAVTVGSDTDPGNLFLADGTSGASPEITCSTVGTAFTEYNTAVGTSGCGTDTQQAPGAPYEPIAFVPAVELNGSN